MRTTWVVDEKAGGALSFRKGTAYQPVKTEQEKERSEQNE
jgi:hypothetical protein